jgi:hypothetical protein
MNPQEQPIVRKVTKQELRATWNSPEFQASILRRTQQQVDVSEGLAPPEAGQVPGTMSHVYDFFNNDEHRLLGTFHCYRRPDGTIGASGMLDPILLATDEAVLIDP